MRNEPRNIWGLSGQNMRRGYIIVLEGEISVGKSTLGRSLQERGRFLGCPVVFMKEYDNPMLPLYLSDQEKYAFSFQIVALRERFNTHREAERLANDGYTVVIDRGVGGDIGFALLQKGRGYFSPEEWAVYWTTVLEHRETKFKPDLVVYLECSPEQAFERLKTRGNENEINSYTLDYFQQLKASHEQALAMYNEMTNETVPMMRVDWSRSESIRAIRLPPDEPVKSSSPPRLNMSVDGVLPESSLERFERMVQSHMGRDSPETIISYDHIAEILARDLEQPISTINPSVQH